MLLTKNQKRFSLYFILILLVSYFSFFDDYFKYLEVKKIGTSEACKSYYSSFPNGYFTEDVKVLEIKYDRDIVLVRDFFKNYPKSEYAPIVELINLEIWNDEINRYDSIAQSNNRYDQNAVVFFKELLTYMRDNRESTVFMKLDGNVKVKDFHSYPDDIKDLMDLFYKYDDDRTVSGNIVNITSNYDKGSVENYEQIIKESIMNSFENLLSDKFISVETYNDFKSSKDDLVIYINYNIENEEDVIENYSLPTLWSYTINGDFESYLIGVSIIFNFSFQLPNNDYSFSLKTNALENISNIDGVKDGYKIMTQQNFQNFADGILTRFGIDKE